MLGRFLEVSVETRDIRTSVEFWERLGFSQCETGDTWPHPYGVVTDGRIVLGLHEYRFPSPSLTFAKPDIARFIPDFRASGIELAFARTGEDVFNEIGFRDPGGQMVAVLEARTYSPCSRSRDEPSRCGDFAAVSLPSPDFAAGRAFWERLGFVGDEEAEAPYVHVPLTSDHLDLALHRPRFSDRALLVFRDASMQERMSTLAGLGLPPSGELPAALDPGTNWLTESPEGLPLLFVTGDA